MYGRNEYTVNGLELDFSIEVKSQRSAPFATYPVHSDQSGAQIFVDGTLKGRTPVRLELLSGKHELRLILSNYYDWEAHIQIIRKGRDPSPCSINARRIEKPLGEAIRKRAIRNPHYIP